LTILLQITAGRRPAATGEIAVVMSSPGGRGAAGCAEVIASGPDRQAGATDALWIGARVARAV